jgi:hypothetical protein
VSPAASGRCTSTGSDPTTGARSVTDLIAKPVREGVDLDVVLGGDSELCDQGQDRANQPRHVLVPGPVRTAASGGVALAGSWNATMPP